MSGGYGDFLLALGKNESGNNYSFVSSVGYLGRFQFGEEALKAIGFYQGDHTWEIDFVGGWTEKAHTYGVWDKASFLNSPAAQDAAQRAWFENVHADLQMLNLPSYVGQWVGGIQISMSGLIAGAHLVGVWNLKSFLETGGAINVRDPYGTPVSEYISKFGGYETPWGSSAAPSNSGGLEQHVSQAVGNILRGEPTAAHNLPVATDLSIQVKNGQMSLADMTGRLIDEADDTTSVATMSYQFFTGRAPTAEGLDYLVSPTGGNWANLNSAYYQGFSLENRYINFAVNLGKEGEGKAAFSAEFGWMDLRTATKTAYEEIFGVSADQGLVSQILDTRVWTGAAEMTRAEYFAAYGQDGLDGQGTKAAMVGWLLGESAKLDWGTYAAANEAYLKDLADGGPGGVDIVGAYPLGSDPSLWLG